MNKQELGKAYKKSQKLSKDSWRRGDKAPVRYGKLLKGMLV
jgi:hypothetical protein